MNTEEFLLDIDDTDITIVEDRQLTDYEIERGKPMPSMNHGIVQSSLAGTFHGKFRKKYRCVSELSLNLDGDKCVPDLCLYAYRPADWWNDRNPVTEPPLTAIEIVSPSQSVTEMLQKAQRYFAGGVRSYWLVQPELQSITVVSSDKKHRTYSEGTVHDWTNSIEISLAEVFED
jgi:Uma2 family endonuclease